MSIRPSEARGIIRKAKRRVAEGESITHLNLTAMMDMMTILLVFMIMQASSDANLTVNQRVPKSATSTDQDKQLVEVVVDKSGIVVNGQAVATVVNGDIDPRYGNNTVIEPLKAALGAQHDYLTQYFELRNEKPKYEITLIADQTINYRLVYDIVATAGEATGQRTPKGAPHPVGYDKIHLLVEQPPK